MELLDIVVKNYNLGPEIKINKTVHGSGSTYLIEFMHGKYIAKVNERTDFVKVYRKVQQILNNMNIKQSRIIMTNAGCPLTPEGVALYEFIEGNCYKVLNKLQFENAVKYIKKYNEALKTVPFSKTEISMINCWDKANSIDFMTDEFPGLLHDLDIYIRDKDNILKAISVLAENKAILKELDKQLIHSDLGADNFIFEGDEIISVIDFTPEYNHELYALCQFIYWNYLWDNQNISVDEIKTFIQMYAFDGNRNIDIRIFCLLLAEAVLFRLIGPILDAFERNKRDFSIFEKRIKVLNKLVCENNFWRYVSK